MPNFLVPRKSGAHRIAAIALYRTLLSQCKTIPIAEEHRIALGHVVRNKFKTNVHLTSRKLLKNAFVAGYEALDHIQSCSNGHEQSTSYILSLLSRLPRHLTTTPIAQRAQPKTSETKQPPSMASGFSNTSLALRPLPLSFLTGRKRRVPILVSANRIPILRTGKPQPPALSMYIKAKMVQRQRRHDRRWELIEMLNLAKLEDSWERDIKKRLIEQDEREPGARPTQQSAPKGSRQKEMSWAAEPQFALDEIARSLEREQEKNRFWAAKMVDIVDKEKVLAEQERKERVMAKNRAHRERKRLRDLGQLP